MSQSKDTVLTPPISPEHPDGRRARQQAAFPSFASTLGDSQSHREPSKSNPSILHAQGPLSQSNPRRDTGRVLILCFDGTGNKFGEVSLETFSLTPFYV